MTSSDFAPDRMSDRTPYALDRPLPGGPDAAESEDQDEHGDVDLDRLLAQIGGDPGSGADERSAGRAAPVPPHGHLAYAA